MDNAKRVKAIVLAAGKGSRMKSDDAEMPKVMRRVCGLPLLSHVLGELSFFEKSDIILVVGYKRELVIDAYKEYVHAVQEQQLGTGHAVMAAEAELRGFSGAVLICYGDMPLLKQNTYKALIDFHFEANNHCSILSGTTDKPLAYGRIVRDDNGNFQKVVEDKDCNLEQKRISELNSGVYVFDSQMLFEVLSTVESNNSQGEYYLTDAPAIMLKRGAKVGLLKRELGEEIIGVNNEDELAYIEDLIKVNAK